MSADQHDGMLIAETNEAGEVTWVWVLENGEKFPRPFRRRDVGLSLDRFKLAGAPREQIATWVGTAAHS